ncbi:MAG: cell division topological specificity factor MinE [Gammaproteobacteria bacterium]|nr:cell division topological specificity factor MinE [Gammaproteobacteria bacterium]
MSIFDYFRNSKKTSASVAKERLQIIVAHQRGKNDDFLPLLQKELIQVISKYVKIDQDQVKVELDKQGDTSVLELNIILPNRALAGANS